MEKNGKPKTAEENQQVDEELLLKQVTELVINQRLLSGKSCIEDKIVNFVHPEELKVFPLANIFLAIFSFGRFFFLVRL